MDVHKKDFIKKGGKKEFIRDERQLIVHDFDCNWDIPNEN
jgi:hypothetical protein